MRSRTCEPQPRWIAGIVPRRPGGPGAVLVAADDPLRTVVLAQMRVLGFEALSAADARAAHRILEESAPRIEYAILSSVGWALELRSVLAEGYPGVRPIVLVP